MPTPDRGLSRLKLGLVRLVTRLAKARFGQVGDQVGQVKDQVGQGQGQELDNIFVLQLHKVFILNVTLDQPGPRPGQPGQQLGQT